MSINFNQIGTVSAGTLRDKDLAPAFFEYATSIGAAVGAREAEAVQAVIDGTYEDGDPAEVIAGLMDAINTKLPSFLYFGAHEGDGADFGVWAADWIDDDLLHALLRVERMKDGGGRNDEVDALQDALDLALEALRNHA
jgi:hypothetical protein